MNYDDYKDFFYLEPFKSKHISPLLSTTEISDSFICSICNGIIVDPIKCYFCEKMYCFECITGYLKYDKNCPQCHAEQNFIDVDRPIKTSLNEIYIKCPNYKDGCHEIMMYEELNTHMSKCKYNLNNATCVICGIKLIATLDEIINHCNKCKPDLSKKKIYLDIRKMKDLIIENKRDIDDLKEENLKLKNSLYNHLNMSDKSKMDHNILSTTKLEIKNEITEVIDKFDMRVNNRLCYLERKISDIEDKFQKIEFSNDTLKIPCFKLVSTLNEKDMIFSLCKIDNNLIAVGTLIGIINIWNFDINSIVKQLEGHKDCVRSIININTHKYPNSISSCSDDKTIKIWDLCYGICIKTLIGHTMSVNCLLKFDSANFLISASDDLTIRMWNEDDSIILTGHNNNVKCLIMLERSNFNNCIISGSTDNSIRLWDVILFKCIKVIEYTSMIICLCEVQNNLILSGSNDDKITMWNIDKGEIIFQFIGHCNTIHSLRYIRINKFNVFVSGSDDRKIKIWDIDNKICIQTIEEHSNSIQTIVSSFDKGDIIISGSSDKTVKIWKIY